MNSIAKVKPTTLGVGAGGEEIPRYCAYSKERSPVCNKLKLGDYKANGIIYERDEYWNKASKIPDQASVLLMSSEWDPAAPSKYAKDLLTALDGDMKELVTFKSTVQGNLASPQWEKLCGMTVLVSFIQGEGDLDKVDKTCVEDMSAAFNWTTRIDLQYTILSTEGAYDGAYDPSLLDDETTVSEIYE